jgi:uncharacterized protein involved in exopolysaccharide biosynthesis
MPGANEEAESGEGKPFDLKFALNLLAYAVGSVVRHRRLALGLFVLVFGGAVSSLYLLPKTYHVETKLFAQRNSALALKGDQNPEGPSHSAEETIMRRDNIVSIVKQTDLVHEWYLRRAPLGHLKDVLSKAFGKAESEQDTIAWMADLLAKQMKAWSYTEGVIQISIDWPDPVMALRLVQTAVQNYLDARRATEVTATEEQVAILQSHAETLRKDIDTSVDAIEKLRAARLAKPVASVPSATPSPQPSAAPIPMPAGPVRPSRSSQPDPELARLKTTIETKQRAISDLEEFRRRRLSELNASLAEKSATYTENHPVIMDLRQTIASLSSESPEVTALRADVARLEQEFDEKSAAAAEDARVSLAPMMGARVGAPPPLPSSIIRIEQEPSDERDPEMVYARNQLRDAMEKYSSLRAQIEMAQIDLDTAQAAFKYRYTVVAPPAFPKKPAKPNPLIIGLAGFLAGILIASLTAVGLDLRRGRFEATWQVERALDLPMLAEMDVAQLTQHKIE